MAKKYRDRQNDERRIVYWLKKHTNRISKVLDKVSK